MHLQQHHIHNFEASTLCQEMWQKFDHKLGVASQYQYHTRSHLDFCMFDCDVCVVANIEAHKVLVS